MFRNATIATLALGLLLGSAAAARAGAPPQLPFQGTLFDEAGNPIDAPTTMVFELRFYVTAYDATPAVTWTQTQVVDVEGGWFSAYLGGDGGDGPVLDLSLFRDHALIEVVITVDNDEPMEPFELATTAFAAYAEFAGGVDWSHIAGIPADLADGDSDPRYGARDGILLDPQDATFYLDPTYAQRRVFNPDPQAPPGGCPAGQTIRTIAESGALTCQAGATGDVTGVYGVDGLQGGGGEGELLLSVDHLTLGKYYLKRDENLDFTPDDIADDGVISDDEASDTLTIGSDGAVAWSALTSYPVCDTPGRAVTGLGDALTCSAFDATPDTIADDGSIALASEVAGVLPIANGGTGSSTASTARAALGLGQERIVIQTSVTAQSTQVGPDANRFAAQSFFAEANTLRAFGVWLKEGTANGAVVLSICKTGESTLPDENACLYTSALIDPDTSGKWYYVTGINVGLTVGTRYWVVIDGDANEGATGKTMTGAGPYYTNTGQGHAYRAKGTTVWWTSNSPLAVYVEQFDADVARAAQRGVQRALQGTWCGLCGDASTTVIACQLYDVCNACPIGYTKLSLSNALWGSASIADSVCIAD